MSAALCPKHNAVVPCNECSIEALLDESFDDVLQLAPVIQLPEIQLPEPNPYGNISIDPNHETEARDAAEMVKALVESIKPPVPKRIQIDLESGVEVPPFDPGVIKGIYKRIVDLALKGTTIPPQFCYRVAKVFMGLLIAKNVRFETFNGTPQTYLCNFGETGTGKGESYRRCREVMAPKTLLARYAMKIYDSADSGAGLKDLFFESPVDVPVLVYIDEIKSLGNKASEKKNPEIFDVIGELADGTTISRVKAAKGKTSGAKTKDNAFLGVVACSPDSGSWMHAIAGRTDSGFSDRFIPEYGEPVEAGDLPAIDQTEIAQLQAEIADLVAKTQTLKMSPEAKEIFEEFWSAQIASVRKKVRFRKDLQLDAYLNAFGCGKTTVEPEDMKDAITCFRRQLILREKLFQNEVPDRIGYYIGMFQRLSEKMTEKIKAGADPWLVAMTKRDFQRASNANRNNELHTFNVAWRNFESDWLVRLDRKSSANGSVTSRFIPVDEGEGI